MSEKKFSENFKKLLELKGIRKKYLAQKAGLSISMIAHIALGITRPSHKTIVKLAGALDMSPDDLYMLNREDFDVETLFSPPKKKSIVIPFLFHFSKVDFSMIETIRNQEFEDIGRSLFKNFISYPRCQPFELMHDRKIICFDIDYDIGMEPNIEPNDIVTLDLLDRTPVDRQIFLCHVNGSLKLRYVKETIFQETHFLRIWAMRREFPEDLVNLDETPINPILGRVNTVTRRYG